MDKLEIERLKKKKYVFNKSTDSEIYNNYELFLASLIRDYSKTMAALNYYYFNASDLGVLEEDVSEGIYMILKDNFFTFTKNNIDVVEYNPLFLICSLENDYEGTLKILLKYGSEKTNIPYFKRENTRLEQVLVDNDFLLNKNNFSLVNYSSSFLMASLKTDLKKTLKFLNINKVNDLFLYPYQTIELLDLLFVNNDIDFEELPSSLKNVIVRYIDQDYEYNKDFIDSLIENKKIPIGYVTSNVLLASTSFLKEYENNDDLYKYIYMNIDGYDSKDYKEADERFILKHLGIDYKKCKSIEEAIRVMYYNNVTRTDMSLIELLAVQLYAAKELNKNGIDKRVDVFAFDFKMSSLGTCSDKMVNLMINGEADTILDMVNVLHHEIEHAIQEKNIRTCNISQDADIDVYSKDEILRDLLGKDYYDDNHNRISFEFDAEFKSHIKSAKLFELVDIIYEKDKDFLIMEENAIKTVEFSKDITSESEYFQNLERDANCRCLNELFEEKMRELYNKDRKKFSTYIQKYPIIGYEYNFECGFRRKSIKELVDSIEKTADKKEKGIYFQLLKSRLNNNKEKYSDILSSYSSLVKLREDQSYSEITKRIIEKLIETYGSYEFNKYKGYFYKIGGNKR